MKLYQSIARSGAIAALVLSVAWPSGPALAQNLLDFLFGRPPAASQRPQMQPQSPLGPRSPGSPDFPGMPMSGGSNTQLGNSNTGRGVYYCVRLCDGRYFPIERHAGVTPNQLCTALCPASQTKVYSGSVIGQAVAADGGRYSDLKNAYVYRTKILNDCTCNGKSTFGLAAIDISSDPTLRVGDRTATDDTNSTGAVRPAASGGTSPAAVR